MQQTGIGSAGEVQEVFREVLTQPDFSYAGTPPLVRAFRAIIQWVEDLLGRWFPALDASEARALSWIVLAVCAAFALRLIIRRLGDGGSRRRSSAVREPSSRERPRDADEWIALARRAAREGRLRDAATGVYQATILGLDARGKLRYREWKTPGDYALEVTGQEVRAPFLDFLGRFVEVAFGPSEPTPEAYESLTAVAVRLGGSA